MRQILHLVWFDVKALKWWLAAWGAVLLAQVMGDAVLSSQVYSPTTSAAALAKVGSDLGIASRIGLPVVRIGLVALITARLVHRDPLLGTTARWMTMPIARWKLLTSKLLTALVTLVIPPAVIAAIAVLLFGLLPGDAARAAWPVAAEHGVPVLIAFVLAVVTATLTHFVMAIAGVFALSLLFAVLLPLSYGWWPTAGIDVGGWRTAILVVVPLLGAAAVIIHQYLTLRTRRSVAMVVCALVLSVGALRFVRAEPSIAPATKVDRTVIDPDSVAVTIGLDDVQTITRQRGYEQVATTYAYMKSNGQPSSVILRPVWIDSEVRYPGAATIRSTPDQQGTPLVLDRAHADDVVHQSVQAALEGTRLLRDNPLWPGPAAYRMFVMEMPFADYSRFATQAGSFSAQVTFRAYRYRVQAAIPVSPGESLTLPTTHLTIVSVGRRDKPSRGRRDTLQIRVRIASLMDPLVWGSPLSYYVLRNTARRQAVYLTLSYGAGTNRFVPLGRFGEILRLVTDALEPWRTAPEGGASLFDDEWMKGAELVVVGPEDLGVLTRPVRVDNFSLPAARTTLR